METQSSEHPWESPSSASVRQLLFDSDAKVDSESNLQMLWLQVNWGIMERNTSYTYHHLMSSRLSRGQTRVKLNKNIFTITMLNWRYTANCFIICLSKYYIFCQLPFINTISWMSLKYQTYFHVPVGHLYVPFGKISIQLLCPFF